MVKARVALPMYGTIWTWTSSSSRAVFVRKWRLVDYNLCNLDGKAPASASGNFFKSIRPSYVFDVIRAQPLSGSAYRCLDRYRANPMPLYLYQLGF